MVSQAPSGKWRAEVRIKGTKHYLGGYATKEKAEEAVRLEYEALRQGRSTFVDNDLVTYTTKSYAEYLRVPAGTIKRWVHEGMPVIRTEGGFVRIDAQVADTWVEKHHGSSVAFSRQNVVYVAERASDGAVKIGWTNDVERRMSELRKTTGIPIVLRAAVPGDKPKELSLHKAFHNRRLEGEWFDASVEDVMRAMGAA